MHIGTGFTMDRIQAFSAELSRIYDGGDKPAQSQAGRLSGLYEKMCRAFPGTGTLRLFSSPGRTEIGGNHTDHQGGCVLCAAIGLDILALVRQTDEPIVKLASEGFERIDTVDLLKMDREPSETGHSASLIRGIAAWYREYGFQVGGFEAYTISNVPRGSGLSSSAAFEVLIAEIFSVMFNNGAVPAVSRARSAQYAENVYFGKPSGLMDQTACAIGGVITIDFADADAPVIRPVSSRLELGGHLLVVTDTGGSHADLTADYASIPQEMRLVAQEFGAGRLSMVDKDTFYRQLPRLLGRLPDRALIRAMHFFGETRRALDEADALRSGDMPEFLRLVNASGRSSWTLLQNVLIPHNHKNQRLALGLALAEQLLGGQGAVRVHGGGFAGTLQAFVPRDQLAAYVEGMNALFGTESSSLLHIRPYGACEVLLP